MVISSFWAMFLSALNTTACLCPYIAVATATFGLQWWLTNRVQFPYSLAPGGGGGVSPSCPSPGTQVTGGLTDHTQPVEPELVQVGAVHARIRGQELPQVLAEQLVGGDVCLCKDALAQLAVFPDLEQVHLRM